MPVAVDGTESAQQHRLEKDSAENPGLMGNHARRHAYRSRSIGNIV
jgi:hypothetical protein